MKRRGFTLFEVLIALMVVVILISSISETINVAFKSQRSAEDAIDSVRDTQTVGDIWVSDVACALPPSAMSAGYDSYAFNVAQTQAYEEAYNQGLETGQELGGMVGLTGQSGITPGTSYLFGPFKGDNISMSFYATGPEPKTAVQSDVRYLEYELAQQPDGRQALVRRADPNLLAEQVNTQLPQEVLVTGVKAITFQYFDGTGWRDAWDSTSADVNNTLPYAVKMTLTLEPVRVNGPQRMLTRFATVWCASKTINDSNNSVAASEQAAYDAAYGGY